MKIRVGLIFGGNSVEHEVSIISAQQVMEAINKDKYELIPIYITKDNRWYIGVSLKNIDNFKNTDTLIKNSTQVKLISDGMKHYLYTYPFKSIFNKKIEIDLVFPVVHGTNVEDGVLQGYLQTIDIPFVGSDVGPSANSQDKVVMKTIWASEGLPVVPYVYIYKSHWIAKKTELKDMILSELEFPMIVKPAHLGSSIGIQVVNTLEELMEALDNCCRYDNKIVIEKMLQDYVEINCSVLGNNLNAKPSVLEKVFTSSDKEYLTYEDKYNSKNSKTNAKGIVNTSREIPAPIDKKITTTIQNLCVKAFQVLDMNGVCRVDCFYNKNTGEIFLNEINNIPGSLSFYLWKESNINFPSLIDEVINLGIEKYKDKHTLIYSHNTNLLSLQTGKLKKTK